MAQWKRHYRKHDSSAALILQRMGRKEEMAKKSAKGKGSKVDKAAKAAQAGQAVSAIPPEKYFVLHSGAQLKSIAELAMAMDRISDEDFSHHVTAEKNDFSNWIRDVFGDAELAESVSRTKDRKESQIVLLKHVAASR